MNRDSVEMIEFGTVFQIDEDGHATERTDLVPYFDDIEVFHNEDGTEIVEGLPEGWEAVSGLTGQYGYSGPCMHASEYMTERVMSFLYEDDAPNVFAFVMFHDGDHEDDCTEDDHDACDLWADEWLVLRMV